MDFSVLLPQAPAELKHKLQRLINQSMENPTMMKKQLPLWRPDFFQIETSPYWIQLSETHKQRFLTLSSQAILKEAISIEHAGIAYANKMALLAESQEERQYYTTVAYEELSHLYFLQPYFDFNVQKEAPAFSKMIIDFVENENRRDSIILIQILLEGWGIHHYQSLLNGTDDIEIKGVFSKIIFDETRHHGGGIILTQNSVIDLSNELIEKIQNVIDAIRVGPFQSAMLLSELNQLSSSTEIEAMLTSIRAIDTTLFKLKIVQQNLGKVMDQAQLDKFNWTPLTTVEMSQLVHGSLESSKFQDSTIADVV
jgi:rubrerythrin